MRIALFGDIHGNLVALDAVLKDLDRSPPDQIVCLGDVAATGPQPHETVQRLMALEAGFVMGNTDEWLLTPEPDQSEDESSQILHNISLWCSQQLTAADQEFIRSFRPIVELELEGQMKLICYHGSPMNHSDIILSTTPDDELEVLFSEYENAIMVGGHTHQPMFRYFRDLLLVNPGSVGLPFIQRKNTVTNPLWAEYAVIASRTDGLQINLQRVRVDFNRLKEAVIDSDMPHASFWLGDWER